MRIRHALAAAAVVVVGLGAVLLWPSGSPTSTSSTVRTAHHTVTLAATEPGSGAVVLDLDVTGDDGRPVDAEVITVELAMRQMGHALPPVSATPTEPGHYRTPTIELPMPGQWSVAVVLPGPERVVIPVTVD